MNTQVYEIKKGRKWLRVRATSMKSLDNYCNTNGYSDWRMVGMMSRIELEESKTLEIVA